MKNLFSVKKDEEKNLRRLHFVPLIPSGLIFLCFFGGMILVMLGYAPHELAESDKNLFNQIGGLLLGAIIAFIIWWLFWIFAPIRWPISCQYDENYFYFNYGYKFLKSKKSVDNVSIKKSTNKTIPYILSAGLLRKIKLKRAIYDFSDKDLQPFLR